MSRYLVRNGSRINASDASVQQWLVMEHLSRRQ